MTKRCPSTSVLVYTYSYKYLGTFVLLFQAFPNINNPLTLKYAPDTYVIQ